MFILLFLLWVALNGKITVEIIVIGFVVTLGVYAFAWKCLDYSVKSDIHFFKNFFWIILYIFVLIYEIIKSSLSVVLIAFKQDIEIQPLIVFFEVKLKNKVLLTVLANSITLTPGTMTVDVEENRFCVHALDKSMAEGIEDLVFVKLLMKMEENV